MVTTSYFASKAPKESKVCIAKKRPRFFPAGNLWVRELAPSNPWADDWAAAYRRDLETRFPQGRGLRELLAGIEASVPDPVLCCYEKDPATCHRSVLAEYIREHLGMEVNEWQSS